MIPRRTAGLAGLGVLALAVVALSVVTTHNGGTGPVVEGARATPSGPRTTTVPDPAGPATSAGPAAARPPVGLTAGRIGLRMPVVAVGVAADGQMALPADPRRIGWYRFGPAPGATSGSVVLGGHLDSKEYGVGPLARLRTLRPGDGIRLVLADGRAVGYRTLDVTRIAKQSFSPAEVFDRSGRPLLRIVTCGGEYDADRGGYQENLVVTAEPEQ